MVRVPLPPRHALVLSALQIPQRVHTIVISTQHTEDVDNETIRKELFEKVIKKVVPERYLDDKVRAFVKCISWLISFPLRSSFTSTRPAALSLVVRKVMLARLAVRSSLTRTVAGALTVVVPSPARTRAR